MFQQYFTIDIFICRVGIWKMYANIAQSQCPQQRIANCMQQYIRIAMANGAFCMWDQHPAYPQLPASGQLVKINAAANSVTHVFGVKIPVLSRLKNLYLSLLSIFDTFAAMNIEELYKIYLQYPHIQTDTRKLKAGDLFFALKGPNFNGNAFVKSALQAGAAGAVIDEPAFEVPGKTILVDDVLTALQQLANHHRRQFDIPFVAITGSNGKTTTKELVHAVLSEKYKVYTTEGNLNNHIGIPLTLLKIKSDAEMAVIEMGANHLHEIESYCRITEPTHGLITNCGKAHLEGFGSIEGVRKGKGELFDYLRTRSNTTAFIMNDYDYLREMSKGIAKIITYGTGDADVTGHIDEGGTFLQADVSVHSTKTTIKTQLVGSYNLPNVLAAVAVGDEFGVTTGRICSAIQHYKPSNSRSQLVEAGSNRIILDAYNANPSSMKLAIENFAAAGAAKKILMLGAMAEMGAETAAEHDALIAQIKNHRWNTVVLVGKPFQPFKDEFTYFDDSAAAAEWARQQNFENSYFLIKGSRSSQMEKILTAIAQIN